MKSLYSNSPRNISALCINMCIYALRTYYIKCQGFKKTVGHIKPGLMSKKSWRFGFLTERHIRDKKNRNRIQADS